MTTPVRLWESSEEAVTASHLYKFMSFVGKPYESNTYDDLLTWSVKDKEEFWTQLIKFSKMTVQGSFDPAIANNTMPRTRFFPNLDLNFAENLLRYNDSEPALVSLSESREPVRLSYRELNAQVAKVSAGMEQAGIVSGDRVVGLLPNCAEAVIAMLATTSLGALWSSCSPDFGLQGVLDRFSQIKPKLLFSVNAYQYNGKKFPCMEKTEKIIQNISEIEHVVLIPFLSGTPCKSRKIGRQLTLWDNFGDSTETLNFKVFPFNHPLYILYTSALLVCPNALCTGQVAPCSNMLKSSPFIPTLHGKAQYSTLQPVDG